MKKLKKEKKKEKRKKLKKVVFSNSFLPSTYFPLTDSHSLGPLDSHPISVTDLPPSFSFLPGISSTRSLIEGMAEAGHRRLWLDRYQEYTRTALTWVNRRWKLNRGGRRRRAGPSARTEITYWLSNTVRASYFPRKVYSSPSDSN